MTGSRNARHQNAIVNRTNTCGGVKKSGLAPSVGWWLSSNALQVRAQQTMPLICTVSRTIQTQKYGYRATHGGNMG